MKRIIVVEAVAAVVARWAEGRFGQEGIAVLLFLMGSMDVDASIVTAGGLPPSAIGAELAAIAIGGTIIANMAVKIGAALGAEAAPPSSMSTSGVCTLMMVPSDPWRRLMRPARGEVISTVALSVMTSATG